MTNTSFLAGCCTTSWAIINEMGAVHARNAHMHVKLSVTSSRWMEKNNRQSATSVLHISRATQITFVRDKTNISERITSKHKTRKAVPQVSWVCDAHMTMRWGALHIFSMLVKGVMCHTLLKPSSLKRMMFMADTKDVNASHLRMIGDVTHVCAF